MSGVTPRATSSAAAARPTGPAPMTATGSRLLSTPLLHWPIAAGDATASYRCLSISKSVDIVRSVDDLKILQALSLIHISEPTRQAEISYAVFCLKKKK